MKIYHGSYTTAETPKILESKYPQDFGKGFYCTELEAQAVRWASRHETATVSVYEYLCDKNLKTLTFEAMTEKWLDFIVDCRSGRDHNYDIVIGAMANDQIYNYIADFVEGILTREQFWILAKFKNPTHQICFCSEAALNTLQFVESKPKKR
ncbi:MAG: DUF3990 domain-containing protein [Bacteroidales bacterium]